MAIDCAIVDYGLGNLKSVQNMVQHLGYESVITRDPGELEKARKLILPGVGSFDYGMECLNASLRPVLDRLVLESKVPVLGICLGAQLMTKSSEEGTSAGLGWIDGQTVAFDRSKMNRDDLVPHMGWADTGFKTDKGLSSGLHDEARFYYAHSFHLQCEREEDELCFAQHGYQFLSGFVFENVVGVQFHPEKSHEFGMLFLKNFFALY
jgi:imidazole glycerol-phosphate synthase subunit HisH